MKRRRHTPEQVTRKLAEGDTLLAQGQPLEDVARHLEIAESTWLPWQDQYGAMKADDAKELRELRKESQRLEEDRRRPGARHDMLKELNRGNFWPRATDGGRCVPSASGPGPQREERAGSSASAARPSAWLNRSPLTTSSPCGRG
jgi:putative transposase